MHDGLYLVRMRRNRPVPKVESVMARLAVLWLLSLLVLLWRAQQSWGAIVELTKFHHKSSTNVVDVSFADDRGNGRNSAQTAEQVCH